MSKGFKKWCEICKTLIPFQRDAIKDHEASNKHKQNQEKHLRDLHIKARKANKNYSREEDTSKTKANDKHKKPTVQSHSSGYGKQKEKKEEDINEKGTTIIKYITKLDQDYAQKWASPWFQDKAAQDSIADKEGFFGGKIWILEREEEGSRLRFRNTLNGKIRYDKPEGLLLEDYEEEVWEEEQKNVVQGPVFNKEHKVNIGDWQEVEQGQTYLDQNKAESDSEGEELNQDQEVFIMGLEKRVENGAIQSKGDLIKVTNSIIILNKELVLRGEINNSQVNFASKLRELAENDIELDMPIKSQEQVLKNTGPPAQIQSGLFKKRITNTRQPIKLLLDEELYE